MELMEHADGGDFNFDFVFVFASLSISISFSILISSAYLRVAH